jgi:hypothetical protein
MSSLLRFEINTYVLLLKNALAYYNASAVKIYNASAVQIYNA